MMAGALEKFFKALADGEDPMKAVDDTIIADIKKAANRDLDIVLMAVRKLFEMEKDKSPELVESMFYAEMLSKSEASKTELLTAALIRLVKLENN